jgi:hypothetical protein
MTAIEVSCTVEVVHGCDSNAVQNDPVISMDNLCSTVNKYAGILNDISVDKSAIVNGCSSLNAIEVREHSVQAVVDGPDTEVKSVLIPLCDSEDQTGIRKLVGNVLFGESVCVSSNVVVSGVEMVVEDISTYVLVSEHRVFMHDGHLSPNIVGSFTPMSAFIDSSCDLKFPQNLIITESLFFVASANVVNAGEPLLDVVMEEHNMLTKKCLEGENNLVLFNAKPHGKSSFQYARKIFSASYNYLVQVLNVLHLSVRWNADNFRFWGHASELTDDADDVMSDSTTIYSNSSYKSFVVMIEPEPPPFILNIHVVSDCTAYKKFNGSAKKWIPSKKEAFGIYSSTVSFEYFLEGSELSQLNG